MWILDEFVHIIIIIITSPPRNCRAREQPGRSEHTTEKQHKVPRSHIHLCTNLFCQLFFFCLCFFLRFFFFFPVCLSWYFGRAALFIFIMKPITKVMLTSTDSAGNISLLIHQQTPPLYTRTLSVIDRKAERRLLASKDSRRKPLCPLWSANWCYHS